uniref:Store-operated calcium entry-associated regulatory factor n=1 Tax=Physcomitrium patens TaxID=3218 RepID=A9T1R7_PHYPA
MRLSGVATRVLIVVGWLGMLLALACGHHQLTQSAAMQSQSLQVNSAAASLEEGAPRESLKAHGAESEFVNQMKKMEFHKGLNTSYKRAEPIPQLRCLEGCDNYEPSMVQCSNIKNDRNPKWQCEADLPRHLKFHKTTINCEAFTYLLLEGLFNDRIIERVAQGGKFHTSLGTEEWDCFGNRGLIR